MSFYSHLSPYYDEIFHVDKDEMSFLRRELAGSRLILDIGCGTGNKTELLAAPGNRIYAFDQDLAMLEVAQKNHAAPGISYEALGMEDMAGRFRGMRFDAVLCLGNTLVHLGEREAVRSFIRDAAALVKPRGLFIIQILNYDYILDRRITELPALGGEHAVFTRSYEPDGEGLRFKTRLVVRSGGHSFENEVRLLPLRKKALDGMLKEAGFEKIEYYGGYLGEPLREDSFPLVALARRERMTL